MTLEEYKKKYKREDVVNQFRNTQVEQVEPDLAQQVQQKTEEYLDPNKSGFKGFFGNLAYIFGKSPALSSMEAVANWSRGITGNVQNQVEIGQQKGEEQIKQDIQELQKKQQFNLLTGLGRGMMIPRCYANVYDWGIS